MYVRFYYFGAKAYKDKHCWMNMGFEITFSDLKAFLFISFEIGCNVTMILCIYTSKNNDLKCYLWRCAVQPCGFYQEHF